MKHSGSPYLTGPLRYANKRTTVLLDVAECDEIRQEIIVLGSYSIVYY